MRASYVVIGFGVPTTEANRSAPTRIFQGSMLSMRSWPVSAQGSAARRRSISASLSASTISRTRTRPSSLPASGPPKALVDYAQTAVTLTPLESEPLRRLLICDLLGEEVTRESLLTLRDDIADLRRCLDDFEETAKQLPHRQKYLQLALGLLRSFVELHEHLIDEIEHEFSASRRRSRPDGTADSA